MRRRTHLVLGVLGFLGYTCPISLLGQIHPGTILTGTLAVLFGSVMPDVLDPPAHGMHRGLGHSRRALRFSGWAFAGSAVMGLFQFYDPSLSLSYVISGFFLGYGVHLLADSITPAGLPR